MRKVFTFCLGLAVLPLLCATVSAAESQAAVRYMDSGAVGLSYLAAAVGMAVAAAGCGIGQGLGLKAACEGTARNPEAGGKLMVTLILGLAFIESLAIYALVVNMILLFVNPLSKAL
jgi:F-type H+-transporting ATPase subunit c